MATFWIQIANKKEVLERPEPPRLTRFLERQFKLSKLQLSLNKENGFGVALETYMKKQLKNLPTLEVPWIVRLCINTIIGSGRFSLSDLSPGPRKKSIESLGNSFTADEAATVLHEYFEKLPDKLLFQDSNSGAELVQYIEGKLFEDVNAQFRKLPPTSLSLAIEIAYLSKFAIADSSNETGLSAIEVIIGSAFGPDKEISKKLLLGLAKNWTKIFFLPNAPEAAFENKSLTVLTDEEIGVKLWTEDGTNKIFKVPQKSSAMDLLMAYKSKLKVKKIHLYEVFGRYFRPVALEESMHALSERGLPLLISKKMSLTAEENEELSEDEEFSRSVTSSSLGFLNAPLSLFDPKANVASPRSAPLSPLASSTHIKPIPSVRPLESEGELNPPPISKSYEVNLFSLPASNFQKAAEWDTSNLNKITITLAMDKSSRATLTLIDGLGSEPVIHHASQVKQVIDSSVHYAIVSSQSAIIPSQNICGFGFGNRSLAGEFKLKLCDMLRYEKMKTASKR